MSTKTMQTRFIHRPNSKRPIYRWILLICLLSSLSTFADQPRKQEHWQSDFSKFLTFTEELNQQDPIDLAQVKQTLIDKRIHWKGTLKYLWKNKPHFSESFVQIDGDSKLARVMYYADPANLEDWKQVNKGEVVEYTGVISDVKLETVVPKTPFIFIEVHHLKLIKHTK